MSFDKTWSGDWRSRIAARLKERGFGTILHYARERAGIDLVELADELGPDDIAGAQLGAMIVEEGERRGSLRYVLRDLLVRELRAALPEGWKRPLPEFDRSEVAGAIARWSAEYGQHLDHERTMQAGRSLLDSELPTGWCPTGPDEPIIVSFVDRCIDGTTT